MLNAVYKPIIIAPLIAIFIGAIPIANAQTSTSDWSLTVNFLNVPFGVDKIFTEVKGPFGADVWRWVPNGVGASTTFTLSGNSFPAGYDYQVCDGTGILGGVLPTCSTFSSTGNDMVVTVNWSK